MHGWMGTWMGRWRRWIGEWNRVIDTQHPISVCLSTSSFETCTAYRQLRCMHSIPSVSHPILIVLFMALGIELQVSDGLVDAGHMQDRRAARAHSVTFALIRNFYLTTIRNIYVYIC